MNTADQRITAGVWEESITDFDSQIAFLRMAGAERYDPVRFYYIEALHRRAMTYQGNVRRVLDAKLAQAITVLKERFDEARSDAEEIVARAVLQYPDKAKNLQQLLAAGKFKGLRQLIADLIKTDVQRASLASLVSQLEQHSPDPDGVQRGQNAVPQAELKTIRNARDIWSKLSADRQVAQAFEQAPKNAGPINSHMLILRTLSLIQEISPDYLNRFITYADTLLALDHDENEKPVEPKKRRVTTKAKKK